MTRFTFELAGPEDDAGLRRLLATNPVSGKVRVTFEREPDYFAACPTMGRFQQVLVARERETGALAGVACRATRPLFVNGEVREVGYLGQLRVDRRFRGRWLLSGGFEALGQLHADGRTAFYLTTIIEKNSVARGLLVERPRPRFPRYQSLATIRTLALRVRRSRTTTPAGIAPARPEQLAEVAAFLRTEGAHRQFFPVLEEGDFLAGGTTPGLSAGDVFLSRGPAGLRGVLALWDQSAFKQTVVLGYDRGLAVARPVVNAWQAVTGGPRLPAVGEPIRHAYAAFFCVVNDVPECFGSLLDAALAAAARRGLDYVMVGLTEGDPLLPEACRRPHVAYPSELFAVAWPDGEGAVAALDGRVPHVEIATL